MFGNSAGMECVLKAQQILFMKGKISGLYSQVFTIVLCPRWRQVCKIYFGKLSKENCFVTSAY